MVPGDLTEWGKGIAIFGGVTVGIYAVFSPSYVWQKKQIFTLGSGVLCCVGTVLIVASIFHSIVMSAPFGIKFQLTELQKEIADTNRMVAGLDKQVGQLSTAKVDQTAVDQIARLQQQLKAIGVSLESVEKTSNAALTQVKVLNSKVDMTTGAPNQSRPQDYEKLPFNNQQQQPKPDFGIDTTPKR